MADRETAQFLRIVNECANAPAAGSRAIGSGGDDTFAHSEDLHLILECVRRRRRMGLQTGLLTLISMSQRHAVAFQQRWLQGIGIGVGDNVWKAVRKFVPLCAAADRYWQAVQMSWVTSNGYLR